MSEVRADQLVGGRRFVVRVLVCFVDEDQTLLICFADNPTNARCEIAAFRYRILHMAARLTRGGEVVHPRLDRSWTWAKQLALGFDRLRAAFT